MLVAVLAVAALVGWVAGQWRIVLERKAVAAWVDQRNRAVPFVGYGGVSYFDPSPEGTGLVRYLLGDRSAAWVYVEPSITEDERDRIARAFPEAKRFLHVDSP